MTTVVALGEAFGLDVAQVAALERYLDLLLTWRRGNVTAVRTRSEATERLLADSLALFDVPQLAVAAPRWLDLGAGAGIPGVPLAVARRSVQLTLLDSVTRKCSFLEAAVEATGLRARARVVCARSEAFAALPGGAGREAYDVVLVRAVAPLATVVELAAPLLAADGVVLAVKTARVAAVEAPVGAAAAERCGLGAVGVVPLARSPLADSVCAVFAKREPAPDWLPRRAGLAAKRPLGS